MGVTVKQDNGSIYRFQDGRYHCDDGPAVEYPNGFKMWCKNGTIHRLDGPAIIWAHGGKEWYIDGRDIQVKSQEEFEQYMRLKAFW